MNVFRRLRLNRLLLLCAIVVAAGASITALASALGSGPVPPAKPLAQAIHDATGGSAPAGVSAQITLTDHLLEGASLATGSGSGGAGEVASNPLIAGATGRLWLSAGGKARIELQSEAGDTEIVYDGHTVTMYDAANDTVYRYTPPASGESREAQSDQRSHEPPSVAKIEEALAHLSKHANVSGAEPTDVAGHAAYTVRVTPRETGSLIGAAELSFDAGNGAPLRAAVYSTSSSAPVIELAATSLSYGPVAESVFAITPPADAKVQEIAGGEGIGRSALRAKHASDSAGSATDTGAKPTITQHGHGLSTIGVAEAKASPGSSAGALSGLPEVDVNGTKASELRTELGTILTFERSGIRYLLGGAVAPAAVEEVARGL